MADDDSLKMNEGRTHRRSFVRGLALGASASALLVPASARADDPKPDEKGKDDDKKDEAPKPPTEVEARIAIIEARFGKQLDDDARKSVRAEIQSIVRRAEGLRKFELDNGDGPFPVFTPYRAPLA